MSQSETETRRREIAHPKLEIRWCCTIPLIALLVGTMVALVLASSLPLWAGSHVILSESSQKALDRATLLTAELAVNKVLQLFKNLENVVREQCRWLIAAQLDLDNSTDFEKNLHEIIIRLVDTSITSLKVQYENEAHVGTIHAFSDPTEDDEDRIMVATWSYDGNPTVYGGIADERYGYVAGPQFDTGHLLDTMSPDSGSPYSDDEIAHMYDRRLPLWKNVMYLPMMGAVVSEYSYPCDVGPTRQNHTTSSGLYGILALRYYLCELVGNDTDPDLLIYIMDVHGHLISASVPWEDVEPWLDSGDIFYRQTVMIEAANFTEPRVSETADAVIERIVEIEGPNFQFDAREEAGGGTGRVAWPDRIASSGVLHDRNIAGSNNFVGFSHVVNDHTRMDFVIVVVMSARDHEATIKKSTTYHVVLLVSCLAFMGLVVLVVARMFKPITTLTDVLYGTSALFFGGDVRKKSAGGGHSFAGSEDDGEAKKSWWNRIAAIVRRRGKKTSSKTDVDSAGCISLSSARTMARPRSASSDGGSSSSSTVDDIINNSGYGTSHRDEDDCCCCPGCTLCPRVRISVWPKGTAKVSPSPSSSAEMRAISGCGDSRPTSTSDAGESSVRSVHTAMVGLPMGDRDDRGRSTASAVSDATAFGLASMKAKLEGVKNMLEPGLSSPVREIMWLAQAAYVLWTICDVAAKNASRQYIRYVLADPERRTQTHMKRVRSATIFMVDIHRFSQICERAFDPQKLPILLTSFFTNVTVDVDVPDLGRPYSISRRGDSIIWLFNSDLNPRDPEHARHALLAAVAVQRRSIRYVNEDVSALWPDCPSDGPITVSIGICTGTVLTGNVGNNPEAYRRSQSVPAQLPSASVDGAAAASAASDPTRSRSASTDKSCGGGSVSMCYDVIGNTVNLAARATSSKIWTPMIGDEDAKNYVRPLDHAIALTERNTICVMTESTYKAAFLRRYDPGDPGDVKALLCGDIVKVEDDDGDHHGDRKKKKASASFRDDDDEVRGEEASSSKPDNRRVRDGVIMIEDARWLPPGVECVACHPKIMRNISEAERIWILYDRAVDDDRTPPPSIVIAAANSESESPPGRASAT